MGFLNKQQIPVRVGGKGGFRRKFKKQHGKKNPKQLLDSVLENLNTGPLKIDGIYLLGSNETDQLHFNFPEVKLIYKAHAYIIEGVATKTMTDSDSESESAEDKELGEDKDSIESSAGEIKERPVNKWERRFKSLLKNNKVPMVRLPYTKIRVIANETQLISNDSQIYKISSNLYVMFAQMEMEDKHLQKLTETSKEFSGLSNLDLSNLDLEDDEDIPDLVTEDSNNTNNEEDKSKCETVDNVANEELNSNINENDINLVISQTECSREQAINALKKNNSNLIEAILEVSSL